MVWADSWFLDQGSIDFGQKYSWDDTKQLFKDWKPYLFSYMMIIFIATGTGFSLTLPSIVHGMGTWSPAVSQALVIPPNLCACILTVAVGYSSGKPTLGIWNERCDVHNNDAMTATQIVFLIEVSTQLYSLCLQWQVFSCSCFFLKNSWGLDTLQCASRHQHR